MARKEILDRIEKYVHPFRIRKGKGFRLKDFDPGDTCGLTLDKGEAADLLQRGIEWLAEEQDMLYAQNRWSLLLVFQAMDAAGKDSTIKHVMSGVNPQGCQVFSFKQPSPEDLDHDFFWRYAKRLPERGRIGIFNRSYYEEVLVVRVHDHILKLQKLPPQLLSKSIWDERLYDIAHFEDYLTRQGTIILKFFLHLSRKEQKKRFMERLDRPDKRWKFSASDVQERKFWGDYMHAFEEAIRATASNRAPWYVVPADNKCVYPTSCRRGHRGSGRETRPCLPEGRREEEEGIANHACGPQSREIEDRPSQNIRHDALSRPIPSGLPS
jgi:PPK2 family polyphosphate:nucleotide phosphotransferase